MSTRLLLLVRTNDRKPLVAYQREVPYDVAPDERTIVLEPPIGRRPVEFVHRGVVDLGTIEVTPEDVRLLLEHGWHPAGIDRVGRPREVDR